MSQTRKVNGIERTTEQDSLDVMMNAQDLDGARFAEQARTVDASVCCPTCGIAKGRDHKMIPCEYRYTLDGEPVDVDDFLYVNDYGIEDADAIAAMQVGDTMTYGGGAGATFTLKRIA